MRELRAFTERTVIVAIPDAVIRGRLDRVGWSLLHLRDSETLAEGPQPIPLAGLILIPLSRVIYVQVVP